MKVKFYADIWPGLGSENVMVMNASNPMDKSDGCVRFFFEVDFPIDAIVMAKPVEATAAKEDIIKISKPPWRKEA